MSDSRRRSVPRTGVLAWLALALAIGAGLVLPGNAAGATAAGGPALVRAPVAVLVVAQPTEGPCGDQPCPEAPVEGPVWGGPVPGGTRRRGSLRRPAVPRDAGAAGPMRRRALPRHAGGPGPVRRVDLWRDVGGRAVRRPGVPGTIGGQPRPRLRWAGIHAVLHGRRWVDPRRRQPPLDRPRRLTGRSASRPPPGRPARGLVVVGLAPGRTGRHRAGGHAPVVPPPRGRAEPAVRHPRRVWREARR